MAKRKHWQDAEWLRKKYWDETLSTTQMGELVGHTAATIYYWMKKLGVPIRSHKEAAKIAFDPATERGKHWYQNKSEVIKAAWERGVYDEEWRNKQRAIQIELCDPSTQEGRELRNRISDGVKRAWERGCYEGTFTEERIRRQTEKVKAAHARGAYMGVPKALREARERGCWDNAYTEERSRKRNETMRTRYDPSTTEGKKYRRKISEGVKNALDPSTPEGRKRRAKISENTKKLHADGGVLATAEHKEKLSKSVKAAYSDSTPEGRERRRQMSIRVTADHENGVFDDVSDIIKRAHADGAYDGVWQSPTSIEIAVSDALDELNVAHEMQFRPEGYSRIYDELVYPNVLIEVQGDYWHSPPEARERDEEKAVWAQEHGYHLIEMWEHEINSTGAIGLVVERVLPLIKDPQ